MFGEILKSKANWKKKKVAERQRVNPESSSFNSALMGTTHKNALFDIEIIAVKFMGLWLEQQQQQPKLN